ncbi:sortase, partial [Candidatus Kaiserbacteria bacterium]|nr:sortase [Candidatus Kaiserbacteria bacterium]
KQRRALFAIFWLFFFFLIASATYAAGFAPRGVESFVRSLAASVQEENPQGPAAESRVTSDTPAPSLPVFESYRDDEKLVIPAIGINSKIVFPESAETNAMNKALESGAVRFPSSTRPGEKGNILLFGHSTGLKNIRNKNFAIFNDIKLLKPGDAIMIHAAGREYIYIVSSVSVKNADDAKIELETTKRKLTLSTCKIFGNVEERYIVEANFLGSYPLAIQ